MWSPEEERAVEKLLKRLRKEPLAKEREEFGMLLMKHIDSLTPNERKRYEELKLILNLGENINQAPKPPLSRIIREGGSHFCPECYSTMSRQGFLGIFGQLLCDNIKCKKSHK
jgi:hypothetical protein